MTEQRINGVRVLRRSPTKFFIPKQIVNGVKIPETTVLVSKTSRDLNADRAIHLVTENFALNTTYRRNGQTLFTNTGRFLRKAFDSNLSGQINFTDIGQNPVKELFGIADSEPLTLGNFAADRRSGSTLIDTVGLDFYYNIDVPNFQSAIEQQVANFETYRSALLDGSIQSGDRGVTLSTINLGISLVDTNLFTQVTGHELGGHGNRYDLRHAPNLSDLGFFGISQDFAYNAGVNDAYNSGAIYAGSNSLIGIVGLFREGEAGFNSLGGFRTSYLNDLVPSANGLNLDAFRVGDPFKSPETQLFDENGVLSILTIPSVVPTIPQIDPLTGATLPRGLIRKAGGVYDASGRVVETVVTNINGIPTVVRARAQDGFDNDGNSRTVVETDYVNGQPVATNIKLNNNPIGLEFSDVGGLLGQQLGYRIAGNNAVLGIASSAILQTLGDNLGDVLDGVVGNQSTTQATKDAFSTFGPELLANLKSAGIGALSSFITAELVNVIGVDGFVGEALNAGAGSAVGTIIGNIAAGAPNPLLGVGASLPSAIGSFLGTKLANEIYSFDTIGGQIGAAVGVAALGVAASTTSIFGTPLIVAAFSNPGSAVLAIAAFAAATLIGGLIGSIFGGTPRSGADVSWDEEEGRFVTANIYSRKGGSREAAEGLATTVAETFNAVLDATGGRLANPGDITTGNYGMRKSDYVYRPTSTRDKRAITFRVDSGDEGAFEQITGYGIWQGLTDPDFQIVGGSNYVKRAVYATFEIGGMSATNFDQSVLLGNIASAQAYESYLANSAVINAIVAAESDSVFAAETAINLARAVELGLTKRHRADWFGGYNALIEEAGTSAASMEFGFDYDPFSDQISRLIGVGDFVLGDAIDVAGQTTIEAGDGDDVISVDHVATNEDGFAVAGGAGRISNTSGYTVNGEASDGGAISIDVAATIDAGAGNDFVNGGDLGNNIFGGAGNDTLFGGRLDDWLLGGDGNDLLDAGGVSGGLGGDGNYLNGGAGNDILRGREGSDWLEGGDGVDTLIGNAGGDILTGGAGEGDVLLGGSGDDTYLLRRGDGADQAYDSAADAPFANPGLSGDFVTQRFAGINNGTIARDWLATSVGANAAGATVGGEDSISLGLGITLGDVQLSRSADGEDLIVKVFTINPDTELEEFTGDQLTVADWFVDPFRRVEWLKFADGTEIRIGDVTSFIVGTDGDDVLIGTGGNDFVYGGAGNDQLFLLAGDDVGLGGTGDDLVSGGADNDIVIGGLGVDKLIGGSGNDALSGDAGGDDLYGGLGNDILSGGRGDGDIVVGGDGDDRFKYSRGDGHDIIFDDYSDDWTTVWQDGQWINGYTFVAETSEVVGPDGEYIRRNFGTVGEPDLRWVGRFNFDETTKQLRLFNPPENAVSTVSNKGTDTIEFDLGINIQDISLYRQPGSNDLTLIIARENQDVTALTSRDSITLQDWYSERGNIETLAFYQAGEIDISSAGYNLIGGTDGADGNEDNPFEGTSGSDWISGGSGIDFIAAGDGADIVSGNGGSDYLKGEDGDDVLYGGAGNDILDGGAGADILSGGFGDDTVSYASATSRVTAYLGGEALNQRDAQGDTYDSIENITGGAAGDVLGGDAGDNELTGGRGNDDLFGGEGNDTYIWNIGDGSDYIDDVAYVAQEVITRDGDIADGYSVSWERGEQRNRNPNRPRYFYTLEITAPDGSIVYSFDRFRPNSENPDVPDPRDWPRRGFIDGLDDGPNRSVSGVTFDDTIDAGEDDAIEFGESITLTDLEFRERRGGRREDLEISYYETIVRSNGSRDRRTRDSAITINNHFVDNSKIENLIFADGLNVSLDNLVIATSRSTLYEGSDGDDLLTGRFRDLSNPDSPGFILSGGAGNDVIVGNEYSDTLTGGDGDDVIEGGFGADVIDGGTNTDVVGADGELGGGDEVRYVGSREGVTINLESTGPQVGGDAEGDVLSGIEHVTASQVDDNVSGNAEGNRLHGLGGNDRLDGRAGDDVLLGGEGNDILIGGAGEDNLSGDVGDDSLSGGADNDLLASGEGNDTLAGDEGDDVLSAGSGDDSLDGGTGDDQLIAGDGDDSLLGGEGDDLLSGDRGNDELQGGAGDDRYQFAAGFGQDILTDSHGINEIVIDSSISYEQLWFNQVGDDLIMSVRGGDDQLTIKDFFAESEASLVYSVQTSTHRLFLGHPDTRNFLAAMTAASTDGIPDTDPEEVAALIPRYWHPGTTAVPFAEDLALDIDEDNSTGATILGVIDHDENISGYQIGAGPENGSVTIDENTGAFDYTPDADFNGDDGFTVIISDADNQAVEVSVAVSVAAVDDAPRIQGVVGGDALEIDENALLSNTVAGSIVGAIDAIEVDGEAIIFSLANDADGRFFISSDGVLSVSNPGLLDHEAQAEHSVTVRVTDAVGTFSEQEFTVQIGDVNEENTLPAAYAWNVDENSSVDQVVGQVTASDPDQAGTEFAQQRYHFANGDSLQELSVDGLYRINELTGEITVANQLDFEAIDSPTSYEVVARDNAGADGFTESRTSVSIAVNDLNEANSFPGDYNFELAENEASGALLGRVSASDQDSEGTVFAEQRYYFWDGNNATSVSADGRFAIDELSGAVSATDSYDYESDVQNADYVVVARDNRGVDSYNSAFTNVSIALTNVNEVPDNPLLISGIGSVSEGAVSGTVIATFALSDPDGNIPSLVARVNPSDIFEIVGNEMRLRDTIDYEYLLSLGHNAGDADVDGRNDITVVVSLAANDGELESDGVVSYVVAIEDVNEAPLSLDFASAITAIDERDRVAEGTPLPAITIGALSVTDPDTAGYANATYSYTVDDPRFEIVGDTLRLREGVALDFESGQSVTLSVKATDQSVDPLSISRSFTFDISDQDDILNGTPEPDVLEGQSGRDIIRGLSSDDRINGNSGNDDLYGDDGDDILSGGEGDDSLFGGSNNDTLEGGLGDDTLEGGSGDDTLNGGAGSDQIDGGTGNDTILINAWGEFESDSIEGGEGTDTISFANFQGGVLADLQASRIGSTDVAISGVENLDGTGAADTFRGDASNNRLSGNGGSDLLQGGDGDDTLLGGAGSDSIFGDNDNDDLSGGAGADSLRGGNGNDTLSGDAGEDFLFGNSGDDSLEGGDGNDELDGGDGSDTYFVDRQSDHDVIYNYDASGENIDVIGYKDTFGEIEERDLWFERVDDDLLVTVVGADSSVLVKNWYVEIDANGRANYKIDFFVAGDRFSRTVDAESLVEVMENYPKPQTQEELDALLADPEYENEIANSFGINFAPEITGIVDQTIDEDGSVQLTLNVSDDIDPAAGITITGDVTAGASVIDPADIIISSIASDGTFTVTLSPRAQAAGVATISLTAEDSGGIFLAHDLQLTVNPVADTPVITQLLSASGNSGGATALSLAIEFADQDGSEFQEIWIDGIAAGLSLNAGVFDTNDNVWKLQPSDLADLAIIAPAGWSQELTLNVTARASEGGQTAVSEVASTTISFNAAPTDIVLASNVEENAANGSIAGTLSAVDADIVDTHSYVLLNDAGGRFVLDSDGTLRVADGSRLDFEANSSHQIRVRTTDSGGLSFEKDLTVAVENVNEANNIDGPYRINIAEDAAIGTTLLTVQATDGDAASDIFGQQRYYFRTEEGASEFSEDGKFRIDELTGVVSLVEALNHESSIGRQYFVWALDNAGQSEFNLAETFIGTNVTDVNEANSLATSYDFSIEEDLTAGSLVGTITATDEDLATSAFGQQRYFFQNGTSVSTTSSDGRFTIDAITGDIRTTRALDHESADALTNHVVVARDNLGAAGFNEATSSLSVTVTNVNEAPAATANSAVTLFDESGLGSNPANPGVIAASFNVSDPDGDVLSLEFASGGNPNGWFVIDGDNVRFAPGFSESFSSVQGGGFEVGDYDGDGVADIKIGTITVRANDGSLTSGTVSTDIYLENVNEAPNAPTLTSETLYSETIVGDMPHAAQVIAEFSIDDPDGDTPTLQITNGNENGWFSIAGNRVVFAGGVNLTADFIRANAGTLGIDSSFSTDVDGDQLQEIRVASLTLSTVDADGLVSSSIGYDVLIEDQNEAAMFNGASLNLSVNEGEVQYTNLGQLLATDIDGPANDLRYSFDGASTFTDATTGRVVTRSADNRFIMDHITGEVLVAPGANLAGNSGTSEFSYQVSVNDRAGGVHSLATSASLIIDFNEVNDPHTLVNASGSIDELEGLPPLTPLFDLRSSMLNDPEGQNMRWQFANGSNVRGIWTLSSTGELSLTNGEVDYEELITYYETIIDNSNPFEPIEIQVKRRDPNRATSALAVQAIDDETGVVRQAVFTATVNDVNEGAVLTSTNQYYVEDDQGEGRFGPALTAYDPETDSGNVSFSIDASSVEIVESRVSPGSSADVDVTGYPTVTIRDGNRLDFQVPGDGEWEGGIKNHPVLGGRRYYQLDYSFDLVMTDPSGLQSRERINITFAKHGERAAPPVVFDLDGDGVELVSFIGSDIYFDMNGDGTADQTGWVGADDGVLALDRNANGTIDDISEISFLDDLEGAETDLDGLAAFDSNADGLLTSADDRFEEFKIWQDVNQDGISQAEELKSLNELNITEVDLTGTSTGEDPEDLTDNVIVANTTFTYADGTSATAADVFLAYDETDIAAPIILDYDGDGAGLLSIGQSGVRFDQDGDGVAERTGWFEPGDAILALDRNGDGEITDIAEISFLGDLAGAETDLEGLAAFDTTGDDILDADDDNFAAFRLWFDRNSNGISDAGELVSLAEARIASISLSSDKSGGGRDTGGNIIYGRGTFTFDDGTEGGLLDTGLAYLPGDQARSLATSHWTGSPTQTAQSTLTNIAFDQQSFDRKSKKFRLASFDGELFISPRKIRSVADPRSGRLPPAMILDFSNRQVGLLSTIILDLDGDGLETRKRKKTRAMFDMDGNGSVDDTGWAGRGDGYLVIDRNDNGIVDDGSELSFLTEAANARSGLQALASFDSNGDRVIDEFDARFNELKIWQDTNQNGVTDTGELGSLADHGIASFSLVGEVNNRRVKVGKNVLLATSVFTRTNGITGTLGDTVLSFSPTTAVESQSAEILSRADMLDIPANEPQGENVALNALRAGLAPSAEPVSAQGLSIMAPDGVNVFDYFEKKNDNQSIEAVDAMGNIMEDVGASSIDAEVANDNVDAIAFEKTVETDTRPVRTDMLANEYQGGPEAIDADTLKIALMTQTMSSFGASNASESLKERKEANASLDYFAAG